MAYIDREVRRLLGKAAHHYDLLEDGDRIAVGVSGGKDSVLLLWLMRERLARIPIHYDLVALHVDPGFDSESADRLEAFLQKEGFRYRIMRSDFGVRAHGPENRENPCFLCSRLRRAALFTMARDEGCRKLALGHNQDDFIETFFINICYGAQVSTMTPKQSFFDGKIVVIRPLALVPAPTVERLGQRLGIPVIPNACPSAHSNKREEMRTILNGLFRKNPKVRGNIFHAMSNVNPEYLPPPLKSRNDRRNRAETPPQAENGTESYGPRLQEDPVSD